MNYDLEQFKAWPWLLKLNLIFAMVFLTITLILVACIIIMRFRKNRKGKRRKRLEEKLFDLINPFLFDEEFDRAAGMVHFKMNYLKTSYSKKTVIKQLLIFQENLKGEATLAIKELFFGLGLYNLVCSDIKKGAWHKKARSIFVLSQLGIDAPKDVIEPLLKHKKAEVVQQALLYHLKMTDKDPLYFFDGLKKPLSSWQQIYIGHGIKQFYNGDIPDFSKWLDHQLISVTSFCIKQIGVHDQFENIQKVEPFLHHKNEELRIAAIDTLCKLGHEDLLYALNQIFPSESDLVKLELLKVVEKMGNMDDLWPLKPYLGGCNALMKQYVKTLKVFNPEQKTINLWPQREDFSLQAIDLGRSG